MIFYTLNRKRVAEIQEQLTLPVSEVQ